MDLGRFRLVLLLLKTSWGWGTVIFQLSGFYCFAGSHYVCSHIVCLGRHTYKHQTIPTKQFRVTGSFGWGIEKRGVYERAIYIPPVMAIETELVSSKSKKPQSHPALRDASHPWRKQQPRGEAKAQMLM